MAIRIDMSTTDLKTPLKPVENNNPVPMNKFIIDGEVKHLKQENLEPNIDAFIDEFGKSKFNMVYVNKPNGESDHIPIAELKTALNAGYSLYDDVDYKPKSAPTAEGQKQTPESTKLSSDEETNPPMTPGAEYYARNIGSKVNSQAIEAFSPATNHVASEMQKVNDVIANLPEVPRIPGQTNLEYAEAVAAAADSALEEQRKAELEKQKAEALPTSLAEIDSKIANIDAELLGLGKRKVDPADIHPMMMGIDFYAFNKKQLEEQNRGRIQELEKERDALVSQKSFLNTIQKYDEYDKKGDVNGLSNFIRAIGVGGNLQSLASFGVTKMQEDLAFANILKKAQNPDELTLEEKKAVQLYLNMQDIAAMDRGAAFSAGLGMQQTFEFMRDIALAGMTGGATGGTVLAKQGVMAVTKQFLKNTGKKAAEIGLKTLFTPSFYKGWTAATIDNFEVQDYGNMNFSTNKQRSDLAVAYRNWAETSTEFFTESLSGLISNIGIMKRVAKTAKGNGMLSKALKTYDKVIDKTRMNPVGGKILQGLSALGVGNIPEELFEEIAVVPLQSIALGENRMGQLLDPRFYQEVLISTAAIGGMTGATNVLVGGVSAAIEKKRINDKINNLQTSLDGYAQTNENFKNAYQEFLANLDNDNIYDENGELSGETVLNDLQVMRDVTNNDSKIMTQAEELLRYRMYEKGQTQALKGMLEKELGFIEYGDTGNVIMYHDNNDGRDYFVLGETDDVMILGTPDKSIAPEGKITIAKRSMNGTFTQPVSIRNAAINYFINKNRPTPVETLDDISNVDNSDTQRYGGVASVGANGLQVTINRGDRVMYGDIPVEVSDIYDGENGLEASILDENGQIHNVSFDQLTPIPNATPQAGKDIYILPDGRRAVVQSTNGENVTMGILDDQNQVVEQFGTNTEALLAMDRLPAEDAEIIEDVAANGTETAQIGTETDPSGTENLPRDKDGNIDYDALLTQSPTRFVEQMRSDFGAEVADAQLGKMVANIDAKISSLNEKLDSETSPNKVASILREINTLKSQRDAISNALTPVEAPTQTAEEIAPDVNKVASDATTTPIEEVEIPTPIEESSTEDKNQTETKPKPNQNQDETKTKPTKTILENAKDAAVSNEITAAAQEANTEPTDAQKEAGNYKKGHYRLQGLDISIEQPKGSIRSGVDPDGREWSIQMNNHYGYIRGTQGKDKDHIDVFIGESPNSTKVFVVDQVNNDGTFDEHKVMIGFDSLEEAKAAYLSNYEEGWQGLGGITETTMDEFKQWISDGQRKTELFAARKAQQESTLFEYFTGTISELITQAKQSADGLLKKVIAPVSNRLSGDLKNRGIDINEDYKHVVDNSAIRHILNQHGSSGEYLRGQIPITEEDFHKIADIVENYDTITIENGKRGNINIIYSKKYNDGTTMYVEEKRNKRKELAATSMWKKKNPTSPDANRPKATPISDSSEISENKDSNISENQTEQSKNYRDHIKSWEDKFDMPVNVYESLDDVTNPQAREEIQRGLRVPGWYDVDTQQVSIFLPHVISIEDIDQTIIHEVVAHKGLRGLLGEDKFNDLCDYVWETVPLATRRQYLQYPGVNGDSRKAADEYIAHLAETVDFSKLPAKEKSIWDKIVDYIKKIFAVNKIASGISTNDLSDILRASYFNLVNNRAEIKAKAGGTRFRITPHKQAQLDIIQSTNPMTDDIHTGIRNIEDIHTLDEVVTQAQKEAKDGGWNEWASYPDITNNMLQEALKSGRITVYSSYPIADGIFVTPSKIQAQEYSGGDKIYSKEININDVAWINTDEGQYASGQDIRFRADVNPNTNKISYRALPQLESLVERTYRESGSFSFSGKNKIETTEDVAYIFKELESYSTENSFLCFVKDGIPTILHVGMGDMSSTVVDTSVVLPAYKDFGADTIYMVHNHPSGNLQASKADIDMILTIQKQLPKVKIEGIIINTLSGKYAQITPDGSKISDIGDADNVTDLKVLSFDKTVFSPEYKSRLNERRISSSGDVASFLSAHRLGKGAKVGALLLNRSNTINGNLVLNDNELSTENASLIAEQIVEAANRSGASSVILFGDFDYSDKSLKALQKRIGTASAEKVAMLDVVRLEGNYTKSLSDGTLPTKSTLNDGIVPQQDTRFRFLGEQGAANLDRTEEATIRLDNLAMARDMENTDKDAKTIKMATGWERGADGKWRYEVDDDIDIDSPVNYLETLQQELNDVRNEQDKIISALVRFPSRNRTDAQKEEIKKLNKKEKELLDKSRKLRDSIQNVENKIRETSLSELLGEEHELFKEYPQLAQTSVSFIRNSRYDKYRGFYSPTEDFIWINPDNNQPSSTLAHEIQHAIQHIEGFARGGNSDTANILRNKAKAWSWKKQLEETEQEHPELAGTIEIQKILVDEYKDAPQMLPPEDVRAKGFNLYVRGYDNEGYENAFAQWNKLGLIGNPEDYQTYKKLAGEVESRNVQRRQSMTLSERRASLASETEDIDAKDQIFIYNALDAADAKIDNYNLRFRVTPEMDAEYLKAVEAGDMETAQKMVLEAAEAAGYTIRGEHGRVSKFTIFDRDKANPEGNWGQGFYFTNSYEDAENNYGSIDGPDLKAKITREVERRMNNAAFDDEYEDEFEIRDAVEREFITAEPNVVSAAIKMKNPFVVGLGMPIQNESGEYVRDIDETFLTVEYELNDDGEIDYDSEPTGTLIDVIDALNDELSNYELVKVDTSSLLYNNIDGVYATYFEQEARELLEQYIDYLTNDSGDVVMTSEILRAAIERAGFDGIIDNRVNQKFGDARRFGQPMERVDKNTRHYIAFNSNQIKVTDPITYDDQGKVIPLSERFNQENKDIRFRVANQNQAVFVSNAARAVEGINMGKASPEQWLKTIEKSGGLKAGEDKWMGLSDWLKDSDKKSLTKEEVLDFINEHMVQIEEQHYLEEIDYDADEQKQIDAMNEEFLALRGEAEEAGEWIHDAAEIAYMQMVDKYGDDFDIAFGVDSGKLYVANIEAASTITGIAPRPERLIDGTRLNYTTNGLDNNHEIALIVPTIESWNRTDDLHFGDAGDGRAIAWIRFGETTIQDPLTPEAVAADKARAEFIAEKKAKYGENFLSQLTEKEKEQFKPLLRFSSAYKQAAARKVLVIDEIQSKRHQEGREKGYKGDFALTKEKVRLSAELDKKYERRGSLIRERENERDGEMYEIERINQALLEVRNNRDYDRLMAERDAIIQKQQTRNDEILAIISEIRELEKELGELAHDFGFSIAIPDAPFEKNWHELAMKRMLRYAAENGFDKIAWTKGEQQADRYMIGNIVSSIMSYDTTDGKSVIIRYKDNENTNLSVDNNGQIIDSRGPMSYDMLNKNLSDVVGKEISKKILNGEGDDITYWDGKNDIPAKEISGEGLRVGIEGMKSFYDRMLPSFMNKYGKKWGVKVEDIFLPNLESNGITMHSIDVTPEMKESVMQGQLMFRVAPTATKKAIQEQGFKGMLSDKGYSDMMKSILQGAPFFEMIHLTPGTYITNVVDQMVQDVPTLESILDGIQMASKVRDAFDKEGILLDMTDNEVIFELYNEANPSDAVTIKEKLISDKKKSDIRFRIDKNTGPTTNDFKLSRLKQFEENWVDKMVSVKMFQDIIQERGGSITDATNPYITENLSLGRQQRENELFQEEIYKPMVEQVTKVEKLFIKLGLATKENAYQAVNDYLYARHAPERNRHIVIEEITDLIWKYISKEESKFINSDDPHRTIRTLATKLYEEAANKNLPNTSSVYARSILVSKGKNKEQNELLKQFRNKFAELLANANTQTLKIFDSKGGTNRSGMTDKEAKEIMDKLYTPQTKKELERLSDLVRKSTHFTLDTWYKYHLISAQERDTYKDMYKYFIPLRGWEVTEDIDYSNLTEQAFNRASEIISSNKKAKGRKSKADNPLAYIASLAQTSIVMGNKNAVRLNMFRLVQKNRGLLQDLATIPTVYYIKEEGSKEQIATLERPEQELFDKDMVTTKTNKDYRWHKSTAQYQAHLIPVIIDGNRHLIEMRGELGLKIASAVNNTNAVHVSYLDGIRPVTQFLSASRTSYNPEFIPTNFIRDYMFGNIAYFVEGGNIVQLNKNIGIAFSTIVRSFDDLTSPNKYDILYKKFQAEGGQTGFMNMRNIETMKKDLDALHREMLRTGKISRNKIETAVKVPMEYLNALSENAMRFAVFLTEVDKGASYKSAAFSAKEITVNFNRKGRYTDNMGALYSFFNAAVQGTARLAKLVSNNKKRALATLGAMTAFKMMANLIAAAIGGDDYDELSDYVKFSNIVIPISKDENGKTTFLKIPMAQGIRAITNIADVTVDVIRGTKTVGEAARTFGLNFTGENIPMNFDAIDLTGRQGAASMIAPFLPTVAIPFWEAWRNIDFKGEPLYREDYTISQKEYAPRHTKAYNTTGPLYMWGTKMLNRLAGGNDELSSAIKIDESGNISRRGIGYLWDWNPAVVQHIVDGFLGGITAFPSHIIKTTVSLVDDEAEFNWYNTPILGRFITKASAQENYDFYFEVGQTVRDIKAAKKAVRDIGDMDAYDAISDNEFNNDLISEYDYYAKRLKYLNDDINSGELSPEETKEIEAERDELMKEAIGVFKAIYSKYSEKDQKIDRYEEN